VQRHGRTPARHDHVPAHRRRGLDAVAHGLGRRYADLLTAHERTLRAAFGQHEGYEIGTHGYRFFVAFTRASDAFPAAGRLGGRPAAAPAPV
jgi:class 3 adenylate cyclase